MNENKFTFDDDDRPVAVIPEEQTPASDAVSRDE